jgi:hypothetical protein
MKLLTKEIIATLVGFVLVLALIISIQQSNQLLEKGLKVDQEADTDRLQSSYERIVLGCNTAGAIESRDRFLRRLCDVTLVTVASELQTRREAG